MYLIEFFQAHKDFFMYVAFFVGSLLVNLSSNFLLNSKNNKGVLNIMKFLTEHNAPEAVKSSEQTFTNLKQVYRLNKVTNVLEATDDYIDINEIVESCRNQTLDYILDKFLLNGELPVGALVDDKIQEEVDRLQDDLDTLRDMNNIAEEYRERFNLSSDMSISDIYNYINNQSQTLKERLENNKNKEVKANETETVEQKSEQA